MTTKENICLALDGMKSIEELRERVIELKDFVGLYKIGSGAFTKWGAKAVETVHKEGCKVFLDLKFFDIPATVREAARNAANMGVYMFNVHASGGTDMMTAAKEACGDKCKVIAVTVLTSMDSGTLKQTGIETGLQSQVEKLARLTAKAKLDGIVSSALELASLKKILPKDFIFITPGISGVTVKAGDDQKRVASPYEAVKAGATHIVIGRAINSLNTAKERQTEAKKILEMVKDAI